MHIQTKLPPFPRDSIFKALDITEQHIDIFVEYFDPGEQGTILNTTDPDHAAIWIHGRNCMVDVKWWNPDGSLAGYEWADFLDYGPVCLDWAHNWWYGTPMYRHSCPACVAVWESSSQVEYCPVCGTQDIADQSI